MFIISQILDFLNNIPSVLIAAFGLIFILLLSELMVVNYRESSLYNLLNFKSSSIDFYSAIWVLTNSSLLLGTFLSFGLFYGLSKLLRFYFDLQILDYNKSPYLSYFIFILVLDFFNYWVHRLMHQVPLLWTIHSFHHSATKMTMLTALRDHPLERAILHLFKAVPAAVLGVPIGDYFLIALVLQSIGYLKHSNINAGWGFIGDYLIQSPLAHRIHHSNKPEEYGLNYASIFQFWDIIFGTAKNSNDGSFIEIGLDSKECSSSFFKEIVNVTVDFYEKLFFSMRK